MIIGKNEMSHFRPAGKRIEVTVGESVRIIPELQVLSQNGLAKLSGIPQSTISVVENDRVNLGVERAKYLDRTYVITYDIKYEYVNSQ